MAAQSGERRRIEVWSKYRIHEALKRKGLPHYEVAEMLHIAPGTLSKILNAKFGCTEAMREQLQDITGIDITLE